jgi:hypothetical protein
VFSRQNPTNTIGDTAPCELRDGSFDEPRAHTAITPAWSHRERLELAYPVHRWPEREAAGPGGNARVPDEVVGVLGHDDKPGPAIVQRPDETASFAVPV